MEALKESDINKLEEIALALDRACQSGQIETNEITKAQTRLDKLAASTLSDDPSSYIMYEVQALIYWIRGDEKNAYEFIKSAKNVKDSSDLFTRTGRQLISKVDINSWTKRDTFTVVFMTFFWVITTLVVMMDNRIPSKKKKKILTIGTLAATAFCILLATMSAGNAYNNIQNRAREYSTTELHPPTPSEMLALVNAERAKAHVASLTDDPRLDASAQYKAQDMVTRNYFDHKDPSTGKLNGLDKANELDVNCSYVSENMTEVNIPSDFTSQGVITNFVNSSPHYAAMVNPAYKTTGFGVAGNKVVEQFCQPPQ